MDLSEFIESCQIGSNGHLIVNINVNGNVIAANLTANHMTVGGKYVRTSQDGKVKGNQPKIVNTNFRYRWMESHPERVGQLYQALLKARIGGRNEGWIAQDTSPDDFAKLFSGENSGVQVRWTGTKQHLKYLFQVMLKKGFIYTPNEGRQPWVIVQSHLVPSFGKTFGGWDKEKKPKEYRGAIEAMAEILNPNIDVSELMRLMADGR